MTHNPLGFRGESPGLGVGLKEAAMREERDKWQILFTPARIAGVELRNRIVFQPHYTALSSFDGRPTERLAAYYEERSRGGAGLIVTESQAVHPTGKMAGRFIHAWEAERVVPGYRAITDGVHRHGARIFSQLTHGGHTSLQKPPGMLWAPTQMPEPSSVHNTKAMDLSDIKAVIEGFASGARNARDGGFDGVEIKVAHDGLLRSFASPYFNHRTDAYGGSFQNRMRLSVEVVEAMKLAAGDAFPVGIRICLNEYTPWGYGLEYGLEMAAHLEATRCVDYFNCDAGSFSSFWMEIPPMAVPVGAFRDLNAALKKQSRLPVVAFGRIKGADLASEIIANGEADLIGWARQLIADPDTPNKLREGRNGEVRYCTSCNDACVYQVVQDRGIRCIHNPDAGNETAFTQRTIPLAAGRKLIVVVGGGIAGMKVAETAARRGHSVTLVERSRALGGQVLLAARQPTHGEIIEVVAYLEREIARLGINLHMNQDLSAAELLSIGADVVVVATGSEPNLPPRRDRDVPGAFPSAALGRQLPLTIPGLDSDRVFSSDEVLSGKAPSGDRVLVVDGNGHWEAAGTVEYLAEGGLAVEVTTGAAVLGANMEGTNHVLLYERLAKRGVRIAPFTRLVAVDGGRVTLADVWTGEERQIEVDAIVPVLARRSRENLYLDLEETAGSRPGIIVQRVGDCVSPKLIQDTIADAYALGRAL
jgi:2,4-dienoyl-CoA reductase-like NADH-dependent reductase (Old Yellow Enzyme family)